MQDEHAANLRHGPGTSGRCRTVAAVVCVAFVMWGCQPKSPETEPQTDSVEIPEPEVVDQTAQQPPAMPVVDRESGDTKPAEPPDSSHVIESEPSGQEVPAAPASTPAVPDEQGRVPLNPQKTVLLDAARGRVFVRGGVVLREGVLEMFACLQGTKEHESIVSVDTEAYVIHAALLAVGAEPGSPVEFTPEYHPPQGQPIDIFVNWTDTDGRPQRERAQSWMRHVTRRYYIEPLESLPAGLELPEDGELRYDEKRGDLIWFGQMSETDRDRLLTLSEDEDFQALIRKMFEDSQPREMQAEFVFAGSGFYEEENGQKFYLAESGNLICVANFSDAIIDVAVKSLSTNDALMFEPYTERIPPLGTEVLVELVPRATDGKESSTQE